MAGVSNIVLKIGAETAGAVRELGHLNKSFDETTTTSQKLQAGIQKAAVPAAAALTALSAAGVAAAKAAAEDAKSRQALDSQLQRSLGSTKEAIAANEDWVASMSDATAVAREELRPALAGAVRATGDLTKAHQLLKTALDVSAATGKPLGSVTAALGKAYNGSTGALKKLVPSISAGALASGKWAPLQKALNEQFSGAAAGQAETAAGQYAKLQNSMHELQVEIGMALLPVMEAFVPVLTQVFSIASAHSTVFVVIASAVAAVAAAILVANAALKAYTIAMAIYEKRALLTKAATLAWSAAQWLLNAAMDANPIGLAIIAVAALTAGIVLAYRHSATFRAIVQNAFAVAKQNAVLLLGPMGLLIRAFMLLYQHSGTVREAVSKAFDVITAAVHALLDAINSVITAIGHIHFPSKPSWVPFSVPSAAIAGPAGYASARSGPVINVTINGAVDPEASAQAIRRVLTRYDRRRGNRPLGGGGV